MSTANINAFKANIAGGGARANQFKVVLTAPPELLLDLMQMCKFYD